MPCAARPAEAIEAFRTLYGFGADPATVVADLLEHCHGASLAKALGPDALVLPKDQAAELAAIGAAVSAASLSRLWQMLLKAYDEVRRAPDPTAAVEMALIRLCYAADLPGPEEALKALREGGDLGGGGSPAPSPSGGGGGSASAGARGGASPRMAMQPAPAISQDAVLQSFEDVVALIDERRDIALKLDVEKYVRLISFRPGAISFEPAPGAPNNLAQRLSARLKEWTGQPWLVAAEGGGGAETPGRAPGQGGRGDPRRGAGRSVRALGDGGLPGRRADRDPPARPAEPAPAPAEDEVVNENDE